MKRIAVFAEGQSELIFLRRLLILAIDPSKLSFECLNLRGNREHQIPYKYAPPSATIYFLLVDVGNDCTVVSAIKERGKNLLNKGYHEVIGLRDMYSRDYTKRSATIDITLNQKFMDGHYETIRKTGLSDRIHLYWAIMELEAWLLAMYHLFAKMDPRLTAQFIQQELEFNLQIVNPETAFYHPAVQVGRILKLVGIAYDKTKDQIESIVSKIEPHDLANAVENGRCKAFSVLSARLQVFQQWSTLL